MKSRNSPRNRAFKALVVIGALVLSIMLTSTGASAAPSKMNIVLVVTDDQTDLSIARMPYLSSQMRQFVNFTNAEVNNGICCPSRASILTGQVDTRTRVTNNGQARNIRPSETMALPLQAAGYRTGMFGKLLNGYNSNSGIWPGWTDFQPVLPKNIYAQYNYQIANNGVLESYGSAPADYMVDVLTNKSLNFISQTPDDQPLFLYVAPTSAHTPYVAAPRHQNTLIATPTLPPSWGEADVSDKPAWVQQLSIPGRAGSINARKNQERATLAVDDMVRSIDERLAATGRLDNTVLIFISDNGLSQGEHRWGSKFCEYASCMGIPLAMRFPGQPGRTETRLASNIDMAPTIVDIADTTLPVRPDGISLLPAVLDASGTVAHTRDGILEHWPGGAQNGSYTRTLVVPGFYAIRTTQWRFVEITNLSAPGRREFELYDQINDPWELQNLAANPAYDSIEAALKAQMYELIRATGADPLADQGRWQPKA